MSEQKNNLQAATPGQLLNQRFWKTTSGVSANYKIICMATLLKNVVFFLLAFTYSTASFEQTKAEQIKSIRSECVAINRSTTLKKVTLKDENMPGGGGELTGFYQNGKIKKIVRLIGLSTGTDSREYYFKEDHLIFVDHKFNSFVHDKNKNETDFSNTQTTFRGSYYFNNKKLIDFVTSGRRSESGKLNSAKALLDEASSNLKLLNKKVAQTVDKRLIRGHWISREDNKAHLVFSDSVMTDLYNNKIVGTSGYWFGDDDTLFAKQKNEGDTLIYTIMSLSKTNLTLMYLPRGNLLKFKRK